MAPVQQHSPGDDPLTLAELVHIEVFLKQLDYLYEEVDGVIGPSTRVAIGAYQQEQQSPSTGYYTRDLLALLEESVDARIAGQGTAQRAARPAKPSPPPTPRPAPAQSEPAEQPPASVPAAAAAPASTSAAPLGRADRTATDQKPRPTILSRIGPGWRWQWRRRRGGGPGGGGGGGGGGPSAAPVGGQ